MHPIALTKVSALHLTQHELVQGLTACRTQVLLTDVRFCHAFFQLSPMMEDMAHAHTVHWCIGVLTHLLQLLRSLRLPLQERRGHLHVTGRTQGEHTGLHAKIRGW